MSKTEADGLKKIEIWWLIKDHQRNNFSGNKISWGKDGEYGSIGYRLNLFDSSVRFFYTQTDNVTGEKKEYDYEVKLLRTPCHYGYFKRHWFECPLVKGGVPCGRRVGVLYKNGDYFGCRHCYELTYSSRKVNRRYKMYAMFRTIELETKIEKLQQKTKKYTYKGKLTRKGKRLERLSAELIHSYGQFVATEKGEKGRNKSHKTV